METTEHTFKPFEKVLVRDDPDDTWQADLFSHYLFDSDCGDFQCIGYVRKYCIPYEGNEHLLGTTDTPKLKLKFGDKVRVRDSEDENWQNGIFVAIVSDKHQRFYAVTKKAPRVSGYEFCELYDWKQE